MSTVVDIHSHLYPRSYLELLKGRERIPKVTSGPEGERFVIFPHEDVPGGGRPLGRESWDPGEKLAYMERTGITHSVVSLGNPWLQPFRAEHSTEVARELNAYFARLESESGSRLFGLGVLPEDDLESVLTVAAEISSTAGLHGIVSGCTVAGRALDDAELDGLWGVLERSGTAIMFHPHSGLGGAAMGGYGTTLPIALAFPFETTLAMARLVLGGVLRRFPLLRVVAPHGGGTLPYLAGRLGSAWRAEGSVGEPPVESLERLHLDALVYGAASLRAAADLVGSRRMAFGSDHPFAVADPLGNLQAVREAFAGEEREDVLAATGARLFRLPAPLAAGSTARRGGGGHEAR